MSPASARATTRAVTRATLAAGVLAAAPRAAHAQLCPTGAFCAFGTDETGSSTRRAANAQSLAARNQFLGWLSGTTTQDFDGVADGTPLPLTLSYGVAGAATMAGSGNVAAEFVDATGARVPDDGRYAVSGDRYLLAITSPSNVPTFTIDFARPVAAFGFYAADVGEFGSQLALRFALVGGGVSTWVLPYPATDGVDTRRDGSLLYAGFVSPVDFTSVTFLGTVDDDYVALDDVTVGARAQVAAVPEPATAALVGAAGLPLALAAAARRRARR